MAKNGNPGKGRQAQKAKRDIVRASRTLVHATTGQVMKRSQTSGHSVRSSSSTGYVLREVGRTIPVSRPALRYPMAIAWSDEDQAYVVTVPDLPGCMTHGATYAEAAEKGERAIAAWLAAARHWHTPIPLPGSAASA